MAPGGLHARGAPRAPRLKASLLLLVWGLPHRDVVGPQGDVPVRDGRPGLPPATDRVIFVDRKLIGNGVRVEESRLGPIRRQAQGRDHRDIGLGHRTRSSTSFDDHISRFPKALVDLCRKAVTPSNLVLIQPTGNPIRVKDVFQGNNDGPFVVGCVTNEGALWILTNGRGASSSMASRLKLLSDVVCGIQDLCRQRFDFFAERDSCRKPEGLQFFGETGFRQNPLDPRPWPAATIR